MGAARLLNASMAVRVLLLGFRSRLLVKPDLRLPIRTEVLLEEEHLDDARAVAGATLVFPRAEHADQLPARLPALDEATLLEVPEEPRHVTLVGQPQQAAERLALHQGVQGAQVDALALGVELEHGAVDEAVALEVEMALLELGGHGGGEPRREQDRGQRGAL